MSERSIGLILRVSAFIAIALPISGCSEKTSDTEAAPVEKASTEVPVPKNCLFIILDAAAYKHFSWSGHTTRVTTPFIDSLVQRGFSFRAAYSQSNVTGVSAIAYLTSKYSPPLGVTRFPFESIKPTQPTLASIFQEAGFRTAFLTENPQLQEGLGYGRGVDYFQAYETMPNATQFVNGEAAAFKRDQESTRKMFGDLERWIESDSSKPWFAYVHVLRPHSPYVSVAPFATDFIQDDRKWTLDELYEYEGLFWRKFLGEVKLNETETRMAIDLYEGGLAYADYLVGELWARLEKSGALKDTVVVLASDHGEAFMEHGNLSHGHAVYEEDVHVPLIFVGPGLSGSSGSPVEMIDIYPTLMELFSIQDATTNRDGNSLVPYFRALAAAQPAPVAYSMATMRDHLMVRQGKDKLIVHLDEDAQITGSEIFDLSTDPHEAHPLDVESLGSKALRLYADAFLKKYVDQTRSNEAFEMPEEAMDTLRALGYVED